MASKRISLRINPQHKASCLTMWVLGGDEAKVPMLVQQTFYQLGPSPQASCFKGLIALYLITMQYVCFEV